MFEAAPARRAGAAAPISIPRFDGVIDNGNHLVLSGNRAVNDYLARIGAKDGLAGPPRAEFAFVDLANDERWTI